MRGTTEVTGNSTSGGSHGLVHGVKEESEAKVSSQDVVVDGSGPVSGVVFAVLCWVVFVLLTWKRVTSLRDGLVMDINYYYSW